MIFLIIFVIFAILIILSFLVFSNTIPWFRNSDDNPFKPSSQVTKSLVFCLGKVGKGVRSERFVISFGSNR